MFIGLGLFPLAIDACLVIARNQRLALVDRSCFGIGQLIVIGFLYALLRGKWIRERAGGEDDNPDGVAAWLAGILWDE